MKVEVARNFPVWKFWKWRTYWRIKRIINELDMDTVEEKIDDKLNDLLVKGYVEIQE